MESLIGRRTYPKLPLDEHAPSPTACNTPANSDAPSHPPPPPEPLHEQLDETSVPLGELWGALDARVIQLGLDSDLVMDMYHDMLESLSDGASASPFRPPVWEYRTEEAGMVDDGSGDHLEADHSRM